MAIQMLGYATSIVIRELARLVLIELQRTTLLFVFSFFHTAQCYTGLLMTEQGSFTG